MKKILFLMMILLSSLTVSAQTEYEINMVNILVVDLSNHNDYIRIPHNEKNIAVLRIPSHTKTEEVMLDIKLVKNSYSDLIVLKPWFKDGETISCHLATDNRDIVIVMTIDRDMLMIGAKEIE